MENTYKDKKELAIYIKSKLKELIPDPKSELNFEGNFQLIIAVVLSAQCTDKRVNLVTKELFKDYGTCEKLSNAKLEDIENIIKPCGFYKVKAKNIISLSKDIMNKFDGEVPRQLEDLMSLSGVGRKTASVVMSVGYSIPMMPVDTHIFRISRRLGLSKGKNVEAVEKDLRNCINQSDWIDMHHYLILFGRYYCKAIKPMCENCILKDICVKIKESKKGK